jgi:RNA polymerase sigma-70 factor, ECF subfamily
MMRSRSGEVLRMTPEDRAETLSRFREYLSLVARQEVSPKLREAIDLSGVVQQTLLDAHQSPPKQRSEAQTAAWLRAILLNNLADEARRRGAQKRDLARERSLEAVAFSPVAEHSSPSQRAVRAEELLRMAQALSGMPENQRRAIELHHLEGRPLVDIAETLGTTKQAVAGLLHRGMKALRARLADSERG